tara:strand:- start:1968 stop:3449 length:1482 start_codon:yes stop_codon:yes gene_type:complete
MTNIRKQIHHRLCTLGEGIKNTHIADLNNKDIDSRIVHSNLLNFDYSKQRITDQALDYLFQIPDLIGLNNLLKELFNGESHNPSEDRKVLHTIYRNKDTNENFKVIFKERERIRSFLEQNTANLRFKNLICLSIGGSRLGPELLNEFQSLKGPTNIYFCSSYDLIELGDALEKCNQSETIVFASSKSFATSEILKNLDYVKLWYQKNSEVDFYDHLYGISANVQAMNAYGIKKSNQFKVLDSLGGRFSVWSSISLPAFINSNFESYLDLLEGARLADEHTSKSSWDTNIPVIMALLSVWNTSSLNINNHAIFTYNFRLRSITKYISQLSMESNGKSINFQLKESPFSTSPLIWGGYGIEYQHSAFQWLMQGKTETSCDFIGVNNGEKGSVDSHEMLLAQVFAMTHGKEDRENPFKSTKGNNPCSILQLNSIDLRSLGFLLAIYEHKVFIEASLLGIDPFDQWGVQFGKELALEARKDKRFLKDNFSSSLLPKS